MSSDIVLLFYTPLMVGLCGYLRWYSIFGRISHIRIPLMLSHHPVFPSYCTYTACLSSVTLQPTSYREASPRRLSIILGSVADFLSLTWSLCRILRWLFYVNFSGIPLSCLTTAHVKVGVNFWLGQCHWYKCRTLPNKKKLCHLNFWCLGWCYKGVGYTYCLVVLIEQYY